MTAPREVVLGIAWFRPDQWELLRSLSTDRDILEPTYAQWEKLARQTIMDLARQGVLARKIDVEVEQLKAWCIAQRRPLDAPARAAYAAARLRDGAEFA